MYFESIPLKKKKPNIGLFSGRKIALVNIKTNDFHTLKAGVNTEWEYFMARGYTHWLKPISKKQLKSIINGTLH